MTVTLTLTLTLTLTPAHRVLGRLRCEEPPVEDEQRRRPRRRPRRAALSLGRAALAALAGASLQPLLWVGFRVRLG